MSMSANIAIEAYIKQLLKIINGKGPADQKLKQLREKLVDDQKAAKDGWL